MKETGTQEQNNVNINQKAERLADSLWQLTSEWGDFARSSVGLPLMQAVDSVSVQLALSLGRKPVKEHMQHVSHARRNLTPASYWLQRATIRGLIDQAQAKALVEQMTDLARHLDQHAGNIVKATNEKLAEGKAKGADTGKETEHDEASAIEAAVAH